MEPKCVCMHLKIVWLSLGVIIKFSLIYIKILKSESNQCEKNKESDPHGW